MRNSLLFQACLVLSFRAMSDAINNPSPQFGTVEYVGQAGNDHCQFCHQPVTATYYRVNDALACPACAEKERAALSKDTHAAYMRALLFGIGAAIAGMIFYAVFEIATGLIIGYVALAVGWMVGKAMMKGSGGVGGRRYQITAALLTYAAVSMAAVPMAIHYAIEHRQQQRQQQSGKVQTPSGQSSSGQSSDAEFERQETKAKPNYAPQEQRVIRNHAPISRAEALARMAWFGIASPFFELWEGGPSFSWLIGIVILVVGIRIAWRITAGRPSQIHGPFQNSQPAV